MAIDFSISTATAADVPGLVTLVNNAYRGNSSREGWTTEADLLDGQRTDDDTMLNLLSKQGSVVLTLKADGDKIYACVNLQKQENKIYLGMLTVSPKLQGSGIGKTLLKASEDYARENHFESIMMTVISIRSELIAWYERHGYRATGETKPFPASDPKFGIPRQALEFIVMEKKILSKTKNTG